MTGAFVCAALGITPTVRHADYIGSWLEIIREDNRAILRAASAASKAASSAGCRVGTDICGDASKMLFAGFPVQAKVVLSTAQLVNVVFAVAEHFLTEFFGEWVLGSNTALISVVISSLSMHPAKQLCERLVESLLRHE